MWFSKLLSSLSFCILLTACGFRPLYETPEVGISDISYPLKISTIADRDGQILRNFLLDMLTPEGQPSNPCYILDIKLTEVIANTLINKDETTQRKEATLIADLTLRTSKTNKIVYKHRTKAINSYAVLSKNYYSDVVGQQYAKREALRSLAEKIKLLLTAYFDTHYED